MFFTITIPTEPKPGDTGEGWTITSEPAYDRAIREFVVTATKDGETRAFRYYRLPVSRTACFSEVR